MKRRFRFLYYFMLQSLFHDVFLFFFPFFLSLKKELQGLCSNFVLLGYRLLWNLINGLFGLGEYHDLCYTHRECSINQLYWVLLMLHLSRSLHTILSRYCYRSEKKLEAILVSWPGNREGRTPSWLQHLVH
jgi:hypothetical protein